MPETRRQKVLRLLRERSRTLKELAREARASARTVRADLEHIERGLAKGERLMIVPATCGACDFEFRERRRIETPSRCPKCRSERIDEPLFSIE